MDHSRGETGFCLTLEMVIVSVYFYPFVYTIINTYIYILIIILN